MRPLFPTYLFVRFHGDELKTIKYTHGVARVICFGLEPHEVDEEIIAAVRARMNEEGIVKLEPKKVLLSPGQRVKIGEGPFAGLDAIFIEEMPDRERVVLLLDAVSSYRLTVRRIRLSLSSQGLRRSPNLRAVCFNSGNIKRCVVETFRRRCRPVVSPCFRRPHGR